MRHYLYRTYYGMLDRTTNPNHPKYHRYGGRGIVMCEEWLSNRQSFYDYCDETLGHRPDNHTLDRIDNDKGYEPGNVRWATYKQQNDNRDDIVYASRVGKTQNKKLGKTGYKWVIAYRGGYRGNFTYNGKTVSTVKCDTPEDAYELVLQKREAMGLPLDNWA